MDIVPFAISNTLPLSLLVSHTHTHTHTQGNMNLQAQHQVQIINILSATTAICTPSKKVKMRCIRMFSMSQALLYLQ